MDWASHLCRLQNLVYDKAAVIKTVRISKTPFDSVRRFLTYCKYGAFGIPKRSSGDARLQCSAFRTPQLPLVAGDSEWTACPAADRQRPPCRAAIPAGVLAGRPFRRIRPGTVSARRGAGGTVAIAAFAAAATIPVDLSRPVLLLLKLSPRSPDRSYGP